MSKILGIDLGTTNSAMAVLEGGSPTIIVNAEGDRTTPSVVGFRADGDRVVGKAAKNQAVTNPKNTVFSIKRFMGRKYSECTSEIKTVPYEVKEGQGGRAVVDIEGKDYTAEQVSAMTLAKMKADAEKYLGETVTDAVITVPAYFNDAQRQATKDAGKIAGLNVKRIVNEPTAAALAYGLDKQGTDQRILVFDLGGGTFDVSILDLADGVFEVLSTSGDNHLGGDDWDQRIVNWLIDQVKAKTGADLSKDAVALQRLKEAAEQAKKELSSATSTNISLQYLSMTADGPIHLDEKLTRAKFEELTRDLLERTKKPCRDVMAEAGVAGTVSDVTLTVISYGATTEKTSQLEWFKQQLEGNLGVKVQIDTYPDSSTFVAARNAQQYDFYLQGWNGDYNDPMTFFELWVTGNGYAKFMGGYSNPEYDEMIEKAGASQDDAERMELFGKAEKLLLDEGGLVPLYYDNSQIYVQGYVSGLSMPMFGSDFEFSRVKILAH